jgi:hypothetical protein
MDLAHQTRADAPRAGTEARFERAGDVPAEAGRPGWVTFAAVLLLIASMFNALYGISALVNDDYFAADELLFGDLSMWGGIFLAIAVLQAATGLLLLSGSRMGAYLGILLVMINALGAMLSIGAYPVWSVIVLVVDAMVIYGLTVYALESDRLT